MRRQGKHKRALQSGVALLALLIGACTLSSPDDGESEPPFETPRAVLDAALRCTPYEHPDNPPVLLVHGTLATAQEYFELTYLPLLSQRGYDVCMVTYPDRGLGDMQISAEYVAYALQRMYAETGRKVAMVGHSQGGTMPRWAIKWWPSARRALADYVMIAGPNHGLPVSALIDSVCLRGVPIGLLFFEAGYQLAPDSEFLRVLNAGDETPGELSYTSIYTLFDEVVQPTQPVATAGLDRNIDNPRRVNYLLQDLCPGHFADHVTTALTDKLTFELVLDAIANEGPANFERAGGAALCSALPILPEQLLPPTPVAGLVSLVIQDAQNGLPANLHLSSEEPPLKAYAR